MMGSKMMHWRRWIRMRRFCGSCGQWRRAGRDPLDTLGHDPCIHDLPGVRFACCGHGEPRSRGYVSCPRGVLRFPGDVHPTLIRAAVNRFMRFGVGAAQRRGRRADGPRFAGFGVEGCQFRTALDRSYRRAKRRD